MAKDANAVIAGLVESMEAVCSEVQTWDHVLDCQRLVDCDDAPRGGECACHGDEKCPRCECGKGLILRMMEIALEEAKS